MSSIVKLPFGTGEAVITGTFIPEEKEFFNHKEGYGLPGQPADFEIEKFEVGGVDIVDELVGLEVPRYVGAIDNTRYSNFLDELVAKHWDSIYKQCAEEGE